MLWLKKGFGFSGEWTIRRQNELTHALLVHNP